MRFKAVLIAVGAALAALSTATLAQSTKQPEVGEQPAARQGGQGQGDQSRGPEKIPNEGQAQPQGPTGPVETKSGGAPASSPEGDTPPGMQVAPQGSSAQGSSQQSGPSSKPVQ
jgi:hypothetical protein